MAKRASGAAAAAAAAAGEGLLTCNQQTTLACI